MKSGGVPFARISPEAQPADLAQSSGACRSISMDSIAPNTALISAAPPPTER
jgi:hypothetical protein